MTQIAYTTGSTPIDAYSWTYDAANRVTSMTTTTDGTATYSYDNTNQVTGASYTTNPGATQPANETYSFDSNGNRTNTGYSTGTNNQLLSDGTFNYAYDAEGNRVSRTRISNNPANDYKTTYTWDYRDRLTDVDFYNNSNVLTKHVHYTYDVFDHRISKSLDATGSGSYSRIEDYIYDGNDVALDFLDPDGAGPQPVALATRYLNGPSNSELTDQVFAQEDASTGDVLWLLSDNLGTTRDVVDNTSVLQAHFVYNSFGALASGPANVTAYLYTGQMWDADVGLQYNWHRWYDPAVGRWISEDPRGFAAFDTNLARYSWSEATEFVDPTGLQPPPKYPGPVAPPWIAPPWVIPPGYATSPPQTNFFTGKPWGFPTIYKPPLPQPLINPFTGQPSAVPPSYNYVPPPLWTPNYINTFMGNPFIYTTFPKPPSINSGCPTGHPAIVAQSATAVSIRAFLFQPERFPESANMAADAPMAGTVALV